MCHSSDCERMHAEIIVLMQRLTKGLVNFVLHRQSMTVPTVVPYNVNVYSLTTLVYPHTSSNVARVCVLLQASFLPESPGAVVACSCGVSCDNILQQKRVKIVQVCGAATWSTPSKSLGGRCWQLGMRVLLYGLLP